MIWLAGRIDLSSDSRQRLWRLLLVEPIRCLKILIGARKAGSKLVSIKILSVGLVRLSATVHHTASLTNSDASRLLANPDIEPTVTANLSGQFVNGVNTRQSHLVTYVQQIGKVLPAFDATAIPDQIA